MIIKRYPTRRGLLEENRQLRVAIQVNNDVINDLLIQTEKDTELAVIGDKMAKRLKRSHSPATLSLLDDWAVARGE